MGTLVDLGAFDDLATFDDFGILNDFEYLGIFVDFDLGPLVDDDDNDLS